MLQASPDQRFKQTHFLFQGSNNRFRPIKEKPILGIDYSKLLSPQKYQVNQQNQSTSNSLYGQGPPLFQSPKNSIMKNQTSSSFRIASRPNSQQINFQKCYINRSSQQKSPQNSTSYILPQKESEEGQNADYQTFKKYKNEFQEFYKQKLRDSSLTNKKLNSTKVSFTQDQPINGEENRDKSANNDYNLPQYYNMQSPSRFFRSPAVQRRQPFNGSKSSKNFLNQSSVQQVEPEEIEQPPSPNHLAQNSPNHHNLSTQPSLAKFISADNANNNETNCQNQSCQPDLQATSASQSTFDPNSTQYSRMVSKYIDKNSDYFKHLSGDCMCGKCVCSKCKCPYKSMPFDLKKEVQSMYRQDFQQPKNLEQLPQITMDFHSQMPFVGNIKCCSTTQSDFRPHDSNQPERHKGPQSLKNNTPFLSTSCYNNNFIDWKSNPQGPVRAPQEPTVVQQFPFTGKTLYADSFIKKQGRDKDFEDMIKNKSKSKLSPMSPDFRYIAQTTSQQFFSKFDSEKQETFPPYQYETQITPSAPDQYKSLAMIEYDDKSAINCPSQLAQIEQNRKKKLEKTQQILEREKSKGERQPMTMNQLFGSAK